MRRYSSPSRLFASRFSGASSLRGTKCGARPRRSLQHFLWSNREEFIIPQRAPWKGVDAIKALDVIDPEQMEDAPDCAHSFAPPLKIVRAHRTPAIERNAPICPHFCVNASSLKSGSGGAPPNQSRTNSSRREKTSAQVTDAERNVAGLTPRRVAPHAS